MIERNDNTIFTRTNLSRNYFPRLDFKIFQQRIVASYNKRTTKVPNVEIYPFLEWISTR